jgi:hypothetical protein
MIGVLVEWYGQEAAEGFYHLFEGWVLFMTSLGLLILEMLVLASIGSKGIDHPFSLDSPDRLQPPAAQARR